MPETAPPPDPCALVIFGAAGDLTKRLLVPALYHLRQAKLLPSELTLIGIARQEMTTEAFRAEFGAALRQFETVAVDQNDWQWVADRAHYLAGTFEDPDTYAKLEQLLARTQAQRAGSRNCLFYLATPPQAFAVVVHRLSEAGLTHEEPGSWRRIIIEKPFGTDLASAQALNRDILSVLAETQVYRIDHYLGKETVQNIMVFRFGNGIFEPLWDRDHIDHVQITVAETVGVEARGRFYDQTGALRDMVPNHLCQLLALTAMEPPTCFGADDVRTEKTKVLDALHRLRPQDVATSVVRGQYGAGLVNGAKIEAYRQSSNVAPDSATATYVALKLTIDNWRWAGVPFYLRTGKALAKRRTEVAIQFKRAPLALFRDTPVERLIPNDLVLHIQPEEGATLQFSAKVPGPVVRIGGVEMKFHYEDYFKAAPSTGYETLIYDCMLGDATLFQRADTIEAGWRVVQPILDAWQQDGGADLPIYRAGTEGPKEAEALLARDHRHWRPIADPGEVTS
ncbi:MAG: glucose-6-phosphate dehydrogenase [Methylobacteriaceae bacterium]|nr:glucose-6-phosphate dehydrogenase [Methylobacteriaceae bacterium]